MNYDYTNDYKILSDDKSYAKIIAEPLEKGYGDRKSTRLNSSH